MELIKSYFYFYFIFICQFIKTSRMSSIHCCTSNDNTCSSKTIECPSNICFKLVINKITEERGCLDDLIKLLNSANKDSRTLNDRNSFTSGSSDDQCQKLGSYGNGMSLCKCATHLCNLAIKTIHLTNSNFILFIQLIFIHLFLSST